MSYVSDIGGAAAFVGGLGYHGLSGSFPIREEASGMVTIQRELQRLGYLQSGGGAYGADGKFGPRTATALRGAAGHVGWTSAPYTPTNAGEIRSGEVTIPDDLIDRLRSASPNPSAPFAGGGAPVEADAPVDPQPDGATVGPSLDPETASNGSGDTEWILPAAIAGGVLVVGGVVAWQMGKKKPQARTRRRAVTTNRRKRRRTSRRR
jgi:hypothetical protein